MWIRNNRQLAIRGRARLHNLNVCYMENRSKSVQRATATHEMGHALRLNHPSDKESEYWRKRSIMYFCSSCVEFSEPQAHDKADYREIW